MVVASARHVEAAFRVFSCAGCCLALAIGAASARLVRADGDGQAAVRWHRDASDPRWVQGDVTVNAPPDVVWARLARVDDWTHTLTDVAKLKVLDRKTDDHGHTRWKIELETRTLDHGMLGYEVDSDPVRSLLLTTDRMGVHAVAQTLVRSGPSCLASRRSRSRTDAATLTGLERFTRELRGRGGSREPHGSARQLS
jgi:hypothetical protein